MTEDQATVQAAHEAAYAALMGTGEPETPDGTRQHNDNDALTALFGKQDTPA